MIAEVFTTIATLTTAWRRKESTSPASVRATALLELCNRMDRGEDYYDIPSLCFQSARWEHPQKPAGTLTDVATQRCPDWGLFDRHLCSPFGQSDLRRYSRRRSRGCPMQCTYCIDPTVSAMVGGAEYFGCSRPKSPSRT